MIKIHICISKKKQSVLRLYQRSTLDTYKKLVYLNINKNDFYDIIFHEIGNLTLQYIPKFNNTLQMYHKAILKYLLKALIFYIFVKTFVSFYLNLKLVDFNIHNFVKTSFKMIRIIFICYI